MLGNLGVHIQQYPTGRFGYIGTIPSSLGRTVEATVSDIMAGRSFDVNGKAMTVKFASFGDAEEAVQHAQDMGVTLCSAPGCACRKFF